jgi:predicted RNA-binding protein with PUA domain
MNVCQGPCADNQREVVIAGQVSHTIYIDHIELRWENVFSCECVHTCEKTPDRMFLLQVWTEWT